MSGNGDSTNAGANGISAGAGSISEQPLADEAATLNAGRRLGVAATTYEGGLVIYLHGELGAGKTTLARGFIRAFGHEGAVKSPTYTLMEPYSPDTHPEPVSLGHKRRIHHFDLYRLAVPEEVEFLGTEGCFRPPHINLIEWPERGGDRIPAADLRLELIAAGRARLLRCKAESAAGNAVLRGMAGRP